MKRYLRSAATASACLAVLLFLDCTAARPANAAWGKKNTDTLWKEGEEAIGKGETEKALRLFRKALERDRSQPRSWNYLGGVYFGMGDYLNALLHFKQALLLDPLDVRACNNIATTYERLEEYDKAKKYYLLAIRTDWKYPLSYRNLGILYAYRLNNPELARRFWVRFVKIAPAGPDVDAVRKELKSLDEEAAAIPEILR